MKVFQVDAFTDKPFHGNPAGVCLLDQPQPDTWMQQLAGEMNLSETAFLLPRKDIPSLRWFTPTTEVSLCGHATLATAHVLWQEKILAETEPARFSTRSGILTATKNGEWVEMDFPARTVQPLPETTGIDTALGMPSLFAGCHVTPDGPIYLMEFARARDVRELSPDITAIAETDAVAVIVTGRADTPEYDFVSRFFAPAMGIQEDPVTGLAHCYLTPYWSRKLGKTDLIGFQVSQRTGLVGCSWRGDRVLLRGQAVTVFKGNLLV